MTNKLFIADANDCLSILEDNSFQTIYIDPPYNTSSKNFEYLDKRDDWETFIEEKMVRSQQLLQDTGVIFISIDDNKLIELRMICDKVFGKKNFLGMFITRQATRSNAKHINVIHEYVIVYAKDKNKAPSFQIERLKIPFYKDKLERLIKEVKNTFSTKGKEDAEKLLKEKVKSLSKLEHFSFLRNYQNIDEHGDIYFATDLSVPNKKDQELYIKEINLTLPNLKTRSWTSKERIIQLFNDGKLVFKGQRPYEKVLLKYSKDNALSILNFYSRQGKHNLEKLGLGNLFSTAKPVEMIKYFIKLSQNSKNDRVLDFFAGSGTTAQAVIECNQEDFGNRKFVLCQKAEEIVNNKQVIEYLVKLGLKNQVNEITKLRLEKLQDLYNFEFEEVYLNH